MTQLRNPSPATIPVSSLPKQENGGPEWSPRRRNREREATPVIGWRIEQPEYDARVARVRRELERRELSGLVLFHPIRMAYVSGFFHFSTERPMAIVVGPDGGLGGAGPAPGAGPHRGDAGCRRVKVYPEYPTGGTKHPLRTWPICCQRWG